MVRVSHRLDSPELGLNGVLLPDVLKGVGANGPHAFSVHQHVGDLIPAVRPDGEGLVAAAGNTDGTRWG